MLWSCFTSCPRTNVPENPLLREAGLREGVPLVEFTALELLIVPEPESELQELQVANLAGAFVPAGSRTGSG